ncbi:type IV conjugative transfer system protein TraE [Rheinheimera hassiensis]|uniref:type IV conjugative transfer system protein TraE n=1 Tax=Rheinheimera hassiensis TaxID=1193627 RepID=UPI001F054E18|nr:type IV conjugative transfer system protein TraE [Rheinheimera hassiensis]
MKKKDSIVAKSYSDYEKSKRVNQITIASLSVALCITTYMALRNNVEIIVTPPQYSSEIVIQGSRANEAYMTGHAMSIAGLIGNLNERNVDFVVDQVTRMMTPYLRSNLEGMFVKEAQILKIRKASQHFIIEDMMYEPKNNIVWVWGTKTLKLSTGTEDTQRFTYELRIEPVSGSPRITHFDAYNGVPRKKNNDYVVDAKPINTQHLEEVMGTTSDKPTRFKIQSPDSQAGNSTGESK